MDPLKRFDEWFDEAKASGEAMADKIVLATATKDAKPSSRYLLLKGRKERRFYFFTNYTSRKAQELDLNPFASIAIYWEKIHKQIRIEGSVSRASEEESDFYWKTRPRESQIGAWASRQSSKIQSRDEIENQISDILKKYEGREVPRPEFWGGYFLEANLIEFWTGRQFRVHDRELYLWQSGQWTESLLAP
jgi:pyridoxamine 5'-phosphate oxidase